MVQINFARKEINCKLVYYGPGLSGKTTNLEKVHERTPDANKGELTSISTDGDRTLFFDFMPLDLGEIAGMKTKFHLYTVPGQVYYNSTRKLVLLGADGVIFVADSSASKMDENLESLQNLRENLAEMGKDWSKFPIVLQWNKRDVEDALPVEELHKKLNPIGAPAFEGIAYKGEGVFQTLKALSARVLANINSTDSAPVPVPEQNAVVGAADAPASRKSAEAETSASGTPAPMKIERNEVPVAGASPAPMKSAPAPKSPPPAPRKAPAERPQVATNPLEEIGSIAASRRSPGGGGKSAPPSKRAPTGGAAVAEKRPAVAEKETGPEAMASQMQRRAATAGRMASSGSVQREVRVVGSPSNGSSRRRRDNSKAIGLACGIGVAALAAAAAYYYFFFMQ